MKQKLVKGQEIPFTQIANVVLNDPRLSWKAKGLFGYLYSKPEGYDFSYDRIKDEGADGKRVVLSGLKELEKFGYLARKKQGTGKVIYVIRYEPNAENEHQDTDPGAENRNLLKPQLAETSTISNTDIDNNIELEINILSLNGDGAPTVTDPETFDSNAYIKSLIENKQRHIHVIGLYWLKKGFVFPNKKAAEQALRREFRAGKNLAPYPDEDINAVMNWAIVDSSKRGYEWMAETVYRRIDHYRAEKNK